MKETPQQYTARLLGFTEGRDPWEVLTTSPQRARDLTQDASPGELAYRSQPDGWSITQILAHLADSEIVAAWRFRSILAFDTVPLQPFDQNAWAATFRYEGTDPADSLEIWNVLRRANLRLLRSVDPALHENAGMHQERGRESVRHMVRLYAGHDLNHLGQIERLLQNARSRPGAI